MGENDEKVAGGGDCEAKLIKAKDLVFSEKRYSGMRQKSGKSTGNSLKEA